MNPAAVERRSDLLAVEPAVFDENFAGVIPANHDSGHVYAGNIAFVGLGIHRGLISYGIQ
jgi:hypothetical protein